MKKTVATILLIAIIFSGTLFPAKKSEAVIPVFDAIGKIMHVIEIGLEHLTILSLGLPGSGAAVQGAVSSADTGCEISAKAAKVVNVVDNNVGVAVLAGDAAQIAKLNTKISTLTAIETCYETVLDWVNNPSSAAVAATGQQALTALGGNQVALTQMVTSMDQRIDRLVEQRDAAIKKMWEGVGFRILADAQQKITAQLLKGVVAKYKVSDFGRYTDAVATQVYNASYIQSHYPNQMDQLMLRSAMNSDLTAGQVNPLVRQQANAALSFDPSKLDPADPDYYTKLVQAGSGNANPYYMQTLLEDKAGTVKTQGVASAGQEVSQGQGFIPSRSCDQAAAQQNTQLAQQRQQAVKDLQAKMMAQQKLNAANTVNPGSVSDADMAAATKAVSDASQKIQSISASPEGKVCQDIANPAAAINNQLTSYLQSSLNATNAPKSGNLPFFANFVEGVADSFLKDIITGGNGNTTNQLLVEGGFRAAGIATADIVSAAGTASSTQSLKVADNNSANSNAMFSAVPASTSGQYVIAWDASPISKADHVVIVAGGSTINKSNLFGSITLAVTGGSTVSLKIYDSSNTLLTVMNATAQVSKPGAMNMPSSPGDSDINSQTQSSVNSVNGSGIIPPDPATTNPSFVCGGNYSSLNDCISSVGDTAYCTSLCNGTVSGAEAVKTSEPARGWDSLRGN